MSLSNQEQYLIELINRARANPKAEAKRFGVRLNKGMMPGTISSARKQPLAPHQALALAADRHSQRMLNKNFFSHKDPSGSMPSNRARAAGYRGMVAENIAMGSKRSSQATQVYERHKQLFLSPGHRKNILDPKYREVGTGVRTGWYKKRRSACMTTEMFGNRGGNAFITGVVYADVVVNNNFYSIGEGIGDISIAAVDQYGGAYSATSGPSGGYSLQVPPGTYTVVASGSWLDPVKVDHVVIGRQNVKVDFETSKQLSRATLAIRQGRRDVPLASRPAAKSSAIPLANKTSAIPLARRPVTSTSRAIPLAKREAPVTGLAVPLARPSAEAYTPTVPYTNPAVQILDDGDLGHTLSGNWSGGSPMGCGGDSLTARTGSRSRVRWTFKVTPGRYRVSTTWPRHRYGAKAAPFTIRSGSKRLGIVRVNQRCSADDFHDLGSDWHDLGTFSVRGSSLTVDLNGSKTGYVVADAIRIEKLPTTSSKRSKSTKSSKGKWIKKLLPGKK